MQTTLPFEGKQIRLELHEPQTSGPHPAILILHGSGGNSGYWLDRIAPAVTGLGMAVYAAHYFDSTNTGRATPAHLTDNLHVPTWLRAIRHTLAHIATRPAVDPQRIALVGVSLGAFLSLALAATEPQTIRAVVEISGGLVPPYEAQATSAFPPTLILHGAADTTVPATFAHTLDATLTRLGTPHQLEILPGEGHFFSPAAQFRLLTSVAAFLQRYL